MKIDSSTVQMDTKRNYSQGVSVTQGTKMEQPGTGATSYSSNTFAFQYTQMSMAHYSANGSATYDSYTPSQTGQASDHPLASGLYSNMLHQSRTLEETKSFLEQFHEELIQRIEEFMERIRQQLLGITVSDDSGILDITTDSAQPGSLWSRTDYTQLTITESETTNFSTTGSVITEDGRSIDFRMTMEMSRSFESSMEQSHTGTQYILTDPLVFKLNDAPDTIEDQTWFFDIDGDGTKEEIASLSEGNAFLALDRNGNGIIDDGNELFGAKTGNGFQELAEFDEDGNGWIDENDSVYSKLKIWTKDANGNDRLMSLSDADVGAIYLGAANTQFSHTSEDNKDVKAVVRQTGFYLHESTGSASSIQQIDFTSHPCTA